MQPDPIPVKIVPKLIEKPDLKSCLLLPPFEPPPKKPVIVAKPIIKPVVPAIVKPVAIPVTSANTPTAAPTPPPASPAPKVTQIPKTSTENPEVNADQLVARQSAELLADIKKRHFMQAEMVERIKHATGDSKAGEAKVLSAE